MLIQRLIIIAFAITAVACAKSDVGLVDPGDNGGRGESGSSTGGIGAFLEAVDTLPIQAEATWSVPIKVRLQANQTFASMGSESIAFTLKEAPDGDTSLSSLTAISNDMGEALIDLRLGASTGTAVVTVSHPKGGSLDVVVNVTPATTGNIRVNIRNPANVPLELAPYRVSFYQTSQVGCANYVPRVGGLPNPIALLDVADTSQGVIQSGFGPNTPITVIAEGLAGGDLTLAGGCVEGITVNPAETKVAEVQLSMVPIQPSGVYDVQSTWDISEALAAQSGTTNAVVRLIEFMANPGQAIYDIVIDEIEDAVGFGIDILLDIAGIKDRAIDYINGQLNRSATVETFAAISADLSTMLNELKVTSQLTISKTDNDFNFMGREEWTSVEVSWTWKCEDRQSADCATHVVDLAEAGGAAGAVSYEWTGHVADYSDLIIESHAAQIDVGRLMIYLLEQVILPDVTNGNANSIGEAVSYWVDCDALASSALGGAEVCDPTGFFCAGEDEAAAACEFALDELADFITQPIANIESNLDIELAGRATLVDADADGFNDQIDDGVTTGTLAGSTEPVLVEWSAVKAQ